MPKKGKIFENKNSRRRFTIQLRGYNSDGTYEGKSTDDPLSIQIKNVTEQEIYKFIIEKLKEKYGVITNE